MKTLSCLILSIGLFAFSCKDETPPNEQCISGKIVGQKCDVFALQLDQKLLGAIDWTKKDLTTGDIIATHPNVIGLINLPAEFRLDNKIIFVTLRKPTTEESNTPCYADLPGPPEPFYVVLSANDTKCPETDK